MDFNSSMISLIGQGFACGLILGFAVWGTSWGIAKCIKFFKVVSQ